MAYTEFYVTKGAAADDTNGGGPRLGADDGPVYTLTGGAGAGATATDNGADSNVEDLNNGGWSGVVVDDWICFDTAGLKEKARVKAINVGGDADIITVSPQLTAAGDKSVRVGGAWATIQRGVNVVDNISVNSSGHIPRINVKYNAVAYTETVTFIDSGLATVPITLEGYSVAAGDGLAKPIITGNIVSAKDYIITKNLIANATAANAIDLTGGNHQQCIDCEASTTTSGDSFVSATPGIGSVFLRCKSTASAGDGFDVYRCRLVNCVAIGSGSYGIVCSVASIIENCIIDGATTGGIRCNSYDTMLRNNTIYNVGTNGILISYLVSGASVVIGNIIHTATTGISCAAGYFFEDYNAFYNCTTNVDTDHILPGANDIACTFDPLKDPANDDFRLVENAECLNILQNHPSFTTGYFSCGAWKRKSFLGME